MVESMGFDDASGGDGGVGGGGRGSLMGGAAGQHQEDWSTTVGPSLVG